MEESQEPDKESDEELNAVEAFKVCHTNRKNGMSDAAREAVVSLLAWFLALPGFS